MKNYYALICAFLLTTGVAAQNHRTLFDDGLTPDRTVTAADGQSLTFVTVEVLDKCLTEVLRSPGDCILMRAVWSNLCQPIGNLPWRVEVRESLREVNGLVTVADTGHAPDDRIREACCTYR